jgi:hypothetical protein
MNYFFGIFRNVGRNSVFGLLSHSDRFFRPFQTFGHSTDFFGLFDHTKDLILTKFCAYSWSFEPMKGLKMAINYKLESFNIKVRLKQNTIFKLVFNLFSSECRHIFFIFKRLQAL